MAARAGEVAEGGDWPARLPLRAGPLSLVLEAGDLRHIRIDGHEVVNRIYGAVRDAAWGTVPGSLSKLVVDAGKDAFRVAYEVQHLAGDLDFGWSAEIDGAPDGTIGFRFRGQAHTTFLRNRIGLCVLHPLRECTGQSVTAVDAGGDTRSLRFPIDVETAQPIPGFTNLRGLIWSLGHGIDAELRFEGDVFETEDQRNWIDASFKTFSTPLALPRPVRIAAGSVVEQRVVLSLHRRPATRRRPRPFIPCDVLPSAGPPTGVVPRVGVSLAGGPRSEDVNARLALLGLTHVRARLDMSRSWRGELVDAVRSAERLRCRLEMELDVDDHSRVPLSDLAWALKAHAIVSFIHPFPLHGAVTTATVLDDVRRHLLPGLTQPVCVASGSRQDLYQLHLAGAPLADATVWGMQPQAHATDVTSIAETPVAAGHQVASTRRRRPGQVAVVLRFCPQGRDSRFMTPFAAAWALATLIELMKARTDSVTAFDVPSLIGHGTGNVSPVFHVLADLGDRRHAAVFHRESEPGVHLVRLRGDGADTLLAANLARRAAVIPWPSDFIPDSVRILDAETAPGAMSQPERFRAAWRAPSSHGLALRPFATARVEGRF